MSAVFDPRQMPASADRYAFAIMPCLLTARRAISLAAAVLLLAVVAAGTARAQQAHGDGTPMDSLNMANPGADQPAAAPAGRSAFIEDSKFNAQLKSFYFNRDRYDPSRAEAWALGGSVTWRSGYVADLFRVGAVAYTSQPLYAPSDRDGTLLLKPGQDGYTVLGQAYVEVKFADRVFGALGRKEYNTPYINNFEVRMTPNTFEGATVYGTAGGKDGAPAWRFGGGYISKIKEINADKFVSMSRDAGASVDRGVYLGGVNFAHRDFSVGAIDYYSEDVINIFYTEAKYKFAMAGGNQLAFAAQYTDQGSTGRNLLTGSAFSTHQWGAQADLKLSAATLTLAYTDTGKGADMRNPWSGHPGYTSVQVQNFYRAGESALMAKAAYDFAAHGAPGLTAYALVVYGSGVKAPLFNETETDFNLQWTPKEGKLKGSSWRLRYAHIDQRGGGDPNINDFRFIATWDF